MASPLTFPAFVAEQDSDDITLGVATSPPPTCRTAT